MSCPPDCVGFCCVPIGRTKNGSVKENRRRYNQKAYWDRKSAGVCQHCRVKTRTGTLCSACKDKFAKYHYDYVAKAKLPKGWL